MKMDKTKRERQAAAIKANRDLTKAARLYSAAMLKLAEESCAEADLRRLVYDVARAEENLAAAARVFAKLDAACYDADAEESR